MRGFRLALSFLTRLPGGSHPQDAAELARSVPWFPPVGALVGALVAGSYAAGVELWPPLLAAVVAVVVGLLVTGAFHEDGLADTIDAFGGRSTEVRLRIMKDPSHGTFAVMALGTTMLVRVGAIATLGVIEALVFLPAIHALSRATAVVLMARIEPAVDGLGADYARNVTTVRVLVAVAVAAIIGAAGLGYAVVFALVTCAAAASMWARIAVRSFGGITGDVLGATQQTAEIGLLMLIVALR